MTRPGALDSASRLVASAIVIGLVIVIALVIGHGHAAATASEQFKIVVHPDNPVTALDSQFVRDAYLRKATAWDGGAAIRPVDLATTFPVRQRFVHDVLRKSPSQLKNYWNQQIFSGKGVPPPEVDSTANMVAYVLANRGAIGYLPLDADPGRAKVIKVQ
jgi:ABC-type phosphate transport system substrate-binding protein